MDLDDGAVFLHFEIYYPEADSIQMEKKHVLSYLEHGVDWN